MVAAASIDGQNWSISYSTKTQLDHEERQEFELSSSIKILSGFMYMYSKPIAYMIY